MLICLSHSQPLARKISNACKLLAGSDWVTPARFEAMGGKGSAKNWKRSIIFNKSPIGSILSLSHDSSDATLVCSQSLVEASPPPVDDSVPASADLTARPAAGMICSPVLAVIKAARLRFDAAAIKKLLLDRFLVIDLSGALKLLCDRCQATLADLDFVYHARRDTDKRTAHVAVCDDLLLAFNKLDSADSIPPIYCEAEQLLHIPVLSPQDAAALLKDTSSLVDKLHKDISAISTNLAAHHLQLAELKSLISSSCATMTESLGNSVSRLSSEVSAIKGIVSKATSAHPAPLAQSTSAAQNPRQGNVDRSTSIILFGLPEGSLVDTHEVVDEISTFLTGSVKDIKDMFRIGKKNDDRCRPTIVKFLTVWDKRLLLAGSKRNTSKKIF